MTSPPRRLRLPPPAVLFFGVISGIDAAFDLVRHRIEQRWGEIDPLGESPAFPFPETETYQRTMGPNLVRRFFAVRQRWPQEGLAAVKHASIRIEEEVRVELAPHSDRERPVNIDPGLVNDCRVILATTKDCSHRFYRGDGIWEEITLVWRGASFQPCPWTYRDFRDPALHPWFSALRELVLAPKRAADRRRARESDDEL
jgi:hypothetical protein